MHLDNRAKTPIICIVSDPKIHKKGGMPLAQTKRRKKTHGDKVRDILCDHSPEAAQCLCDMLEDDSLSGTARAGVAKEILERAVGKGQLAAPSDEETDKQFELVLKVVE